MPGLPAGWWLRRWSEGAEPMLIVVADHRSDSPVLHRFWRDRHARLTVAAIAPGGLERYRAWTEDD